MSADEKTRILPAMASATVGTQLGGIYELDQKIASGGMGEVYRGHNIQTGDLVAIKIVLPEYARDPTILSLFKKEATILNHLSNDAIIRYHLFTVDAGIGRPYLAMEFVNGESLVDIIQRGPMSISDARKLCRRLASGLAAAHEAGIIHRDLSPDNVILPGGKVERAKIIDFGIARSATVGGETLLGGKFAGKYNYVSPEQLGLAGGEVTERSDIYSLGLVIAAALRGDPIDMSGTQVDVIDKRRVVPDLSGIDPSIRPLLDAMLQPDPANRPHSMADIAGWLSMPENGGTVHPVTLAPRMTSPLFGGDGRTGVGAGVAPATMPPGQPPVATAHPAAFQTDVLATQGWALDPQRTQIARPPAAAPGQPTALGGDESPFGPYVAQESSPFTRGVTPVPPVAAAKAAAPKSKAVPIAAAAVAVLALAGAGAFFGGLFDGDGSQEQVAVAPTLQPKTTPANDQPAADKPASEASSGQGEQAGTPPVETAVTPVAPVTPVDPVVQPVTEGTEAIKTVASTVSWLRDYKGGDCFYAAATSAADNSVTIEGFGVSAQPFDELLAAFKSRFNFEPEIGGRLIDQAQCAVTEFLRGVRPSSSEAPRLSLARTSIPSGSPVSGTIEKVSGRNTDFLLIDHKGMVFNLNNRLNFSGAEANFSIPIGLSKADAALNQGVPQILMVLSTSTPVEAASFTTPVPAAELLPRVLDEIKSKNIDSVAVAEYFSLGG